MTERERLIHLLCNVNCNGADRREGGCPFRQDELCNRIEKLELCMVERLADHLLANGVIVPPCKVGDTLFVLSTCMDIVSFPGDGVICPYENVCHIEDCTNYNDVLRPFPMTVEYLGIGDHGIFNIFFEETSVEYLSTDFGKTVFLTREDAERALKEMNKT